MIKGSQFLSGMGKYIIDRSIRVVYLFFLTIYIVMHAHRCYTMGGLPFNRQSDPINMAAAGGGGAIGEMLVAGMHPESIFLHRRK